MAFSCFHQIIDTRALPECYIFPREGGLMLFETIFNNYPERVDRLSLRSPAIVLGNNGVMVGAEALLGMFDRLEVLGCSAEATLNSAPLGGHVPMSQQGIKEISTAFKLKKRFPAHSGEI